MEDKEQKDLQNHEETPVDCENDVVEGQEDKAKGNGYAEEIEALRAEFQAKFDKQEADNKAKLAERDGIIKQLLTGEGKTATTPEDKIVAKINSKRNYKKW